MRPGTVLRIAPAQPPAFPGKNQKSPGVGGCALRSLRTAGFNLASNIRVQYFLLNLFLFVFLVRFLLSRPSQPPQPRFARLGSPGWCRAFGPPCAGQPPLGGQAPPLRLCGLVPAPLFPRQKPPVVGRSQSLASLRRQNQAASGSGGWCPGASLRVCGCAAIFAALIFLISALPSCQAAPPGSSRARQL